MSFILNSLYYLLAFFIYQSYSQNLTVTPNDSLDVETLFPNFPVSLLEGIGGGINLLYLDTPIDGETFDFIVIGSGSAGSALANRLSENPNWNILLIEAGDLATILTDVPSLAPFFQFTKLNWGYFAEKENGSCWGCPNRQMRWPRGKALGGTTLINFMIHTRGNPLDYEKWKNLGNPGWGYKDVLPYFKKLEDARVKIQDTSYRNKGGPMTVSDIPYRTESANAFVKAAQEAGYPYVDYNGEDQSGVSYIQANTKESKRWSVEKAYLRPARNRDNLKILSNSRVVKILIDKTSKRAYGVVFVRFGRYYTVKARKEVIVSAGAFNSPQLLMLSGVGPKQHLEELEIPVIKDLPVGQKLYDHISFAGLNFIVNQSITFKADIYFNPANIVNYLLNRQGPLTIILVEAIAYIRTNVSRDLPGLPDMELLFLGSNVGADGGLVFKDVLCVSPALYNAFWKDLEPLNAYQVLPMLIHPKSYGYVKLQSKDPFKAPKFYPRYFTDKGNEDIKTFIASIREIIKISEMPALQKYGARLYQKPMPGCEKYKFNSDPYWECALRTITPTLHHQISTCKMGPRDDPEAVVDNKLRVYGVKNLRVVDTSVIPIPIGAHTNIPSVMIGEKASDIIKSDYGL